MGSYKPGTYGNMGNSEATKTSVASTRNSKQSGDSNPAYKRFMTAELRVRREKGLCYYCDEKYNPQHRCKADCFLLVGQEEIEEILQPPGEIEERAEPEPGEQLNIMETIWKISLNALEGKFHPSTLRVRGEHKGKEVIVFIDSGSNNNFIRPSAMSVLRLKEVPTAAFKVGTSSGVILQCHNKCDRTPFKIQGIHFEIGLYVLEIKGANIVLGVQWLIELGDVVTNYRNLTMQFYYKGGQVTISGDDLLSSAPLKSKAMNYILQADYDLEIFQLQVLEDGDASHETQETFAKPVKSLIESYKNISRTY